MQLKMTPWRNTDTFVPARYIMAMVNQDRSFKAANKVLGLGPKGAYCLVRDASVHQIPHIKRVCDFVVSIWEDNPFYFMTDNKGRFTDDEATCLKRAVNLLITMARDPRRPILECYAGRSYFKNFDNRLREVEKIRAEIGIREVEQG